MYIQTCFIMLTTSGFILALALRHLSPPAVYRHLLIWFSTNKIWVQSTESGHSNISKTFISSVNLKQNHISFRKSWLNLPVTIHSLSLSTHQISLRWSLSFSWSWDFFPTVRTSGLKVSQCNPRIKIPLLSLLTLSSVPSLCLSHMTDIMPELPVTCKLLQRACITAAQVVL